MGAMGIRCTLDRDAAFVAYNPPVFLAVRLDHGSTPNALPLDLTLERVALLTNASCYSPQAHLKGRFRASIRSSITAVLWLGFSERPVPRDEYERHDQLHDCCTDSGDTSHENARYER